MMAERKLEWDKMTSAFGEWLDEHEDVTNAEKYYAAERIAAYHTDDYETWGDELIEWSILERNAIDDEEVV